MTADVPLTEEWRVIPGCARGHAYTPENTYPRSEGGRQCRTGTAERQGRAA